jgi:hypothetical protein
MAPAPTLGQLYQNPTYRNLSPRVGFAWDALGDGSTAVRGGYGLYFNTNNHQNLIVTVTNPPATPRPVIINPTFPNPPFDRAAAISIRPVQWDLQNPRVHVYNANVQRELWWETGLTIGYAGARGRYLLRSGDVNLAQPTGTLDGRPFIAAGTPRMNTAFSTIELKSSDGDSWYNALIVDVRRRWSQGFTLQSSYTLSKSEDTTQASTFFSDATNGTTSALPEFVPGYNKGPSDFDARHVLVMNATWDLPFARGLGGAAGALLDGWRLSGIWNMRSGQPLTVFVQSNRSRSQWNPSRGPGIGQDRPDYAPGYGPHNAVLGRPEQWFDPAAFALQPAGTFGNTGRGDFRGPNLRTLDMSLTRDLIRGASPLGLPYTLSRSPLRRLASAFAKATADLAEAPSARRRAVRVAHSLALIRVVICEMPSAPRSAPARRRGSRPRQRRAARAWGSRALPAPGAASPRTRPTTEPSPLRIRASAFNAPSTTDVG